MNTENKLTNKRYSSVLEMVKANSDPEYAAAFEKSLKKITVYVYIDSNLGFVQVFKKLKSAQLFAEGMQNGATIWECRTDKKGDELWVLGNIEIHKCQIIKA